MDTLENVLSIASVIALFVLLIVGLTFAFSFASIEEEFTVGQVVDKRYGSEGAFIIEIGYFEFLGIDRVKTYEVPEDFYRSISVGDVVDMDELCKVGD